MPKAAANWLNNEYFGRLNKAGLSIADGPVSARRRTAPSSQMVSANTISGKIAKDLLDIVWSEGGDPRAIVEARGLKQVTDTSRDREGGRCRDRREPRQGRRGESETETRRVVCRSGDEADAVEKQIRRP